MYIIHGFIQIHVPKFQNGYREHVHCITWIVWLTGRALKWIISAAYFSATSESDLTIRFCGEKEQEKKSNVRGLGFGFIKRTHMKHLPASVFSPGFANDYIHM